MASSWSKFLAAKAKTGSTNPYIPVTLHAKQQEFFDNDENEGLFGGAVGGGKSVAQLAAALKYVHVPGYSAILFRRTYPQLSLPGGLIPISQEWLSNTDARWFGSDRAWLFPSGAKLVFGHLDNDRQRYKYQGPAFQYCGFDEVTQFPQEHYTYLFSRLRKPEGMPVPIRMRASGNPGGEGHEWVKRRFIIEGEANGRFFIPSFLSDNPSLDQEAYLKSLMELDPLTRAQLLEGDWDAVPQGGMFKRSWFGIVQPHEVSPATRWVRYWDRAATEASLGSDPDYTVGAKVGLHKGVWYIADLQRFRENPEGNEVRIAQTAAADGRRVKIYMEHEPGSAGKDVIAHYARRVLTGYAFEGHRPTGSKVERAQPLASAAAQGLVKLVEGAWINTFLDEATGFPLTSHLDQIDACSGAMAVINARPRGITTLRVTDL